MGRKIMFLGPSGSGKTTLAKAISEEFGIQFISGSYSDLMPSTKNESHNEMLKKPVGEIYSQDHQLLSIRSKVYSSNDEFVTDRSYIDNMAYFILKLAKDVKECDTDSFRDNIITLLDRDCTDIIFVPFTDSSINKWKIEDNGKRVTNIYFQWEVSQVMYGLLRYFGLKKDFLYKMKGMSVGRMSPLNLIGKSEKTIRVLILNSMDHKVRMKQIRKFLNGK